MIELGTIIPVLGMRGRGMKLNGAFRIRQRLRRPWRRIKWAWQRVVRGYDDTALWSLDYWLVEKMLDMLPRMKDKYGIPGWCFAEDCGDRAYTEEEWEQAKAVWNEQVDKMIDGFQAAQQLLDMEYDKDYETTHARYHAGMGVFIEGLFDLWN